MTLEKKKAEIVKQAKHYFGKDKSFIKELVLGFEFKGENYKRWKKEIANTISNPFKVSFGLFDDVIEFIIDKQVSKIDWNLIGDLSWTIDIVLNPEVDKVYDLDKKLALKCNGTARILTLYISDIIPCYTINCYYMTYSKSQNYYEFGPITTFTKEEQKTLKNVKAFMETKGLEMVDKAFTQKKYKHLYSDTNSNGNASLFDVLFSDVQEYTEEVERFCDEEIVEKSGTKFRWREFYNKKGVLNRRIESRRTIAGDYLEVIFDNKGQITEVNVTRKKIERKNYERFKLNIIETFKRRKK